MGQTYDVLQIGYGPVSEGLALMLARKGHRVAVCERWETRYPMPRAVCIDHELYRVLSANGMGAVLPTVSQRGPLYQWFNAEWKELLVIDWSADSISGGPEVNFVHQPTLEEALDQAASAQPTLETFLGWEATEVTQDDELAHVRLRQVATGEERTLSSRYLIGCDGANSLVRQTIGGGQEDRGFEADWLVIDVLLKDGVTIEQLGLPAAGQYCNPVQPTTIVPAGIRGDRTFRRWEFMRLPGQSVEELEREERVWELLKPWAGPDDIELVRHKVYNFRSLLAERWRDRRFLIAGDAAHVMPPFMGQGMCSGLRDAWNLAWRLDLVLSGKADDRLLDGYEPERRPHVSQLIDMSIYLGKIICIPDAEAAAARDRESAGGAVSAGAGLLSPHVTVAATNGFVGRLDDYTGDGFIILGRGFDPRASLDAAALDAFDRIGARLLQIDGATAKGEIADVDGRLTDFLDAQGWNAAIIRPDFYVYGGAADEGSYLGLARDLIADLVANGLNLDSSHHPEVKNETSAL
nr:bifunctional 3-(3-hydroxy-phenyl)propionate/3-hydroxycinnamic acid hydroxylase [Sphingobium xenophagum]